VNRFKKLRLIVIALLVVATVTPVTSAFADSRHRKETRYSRGGRSYYHHRGRVARYSRHRGGFFVYAGAPYPFYVPHRYWHHNRFRVGAWIDVGGYYNPRGYYDYYYSPYSYRDRDRGDRDELRFVEATLTGVVESVDERRARFILKNDATGSLITISMFQAGGRTEVRPGDHLRIEGEWTRSGVFDAIEIDLLRD
jgi:hypothetical protein